MKPAPLFHDIASGPEDGAAYWVRAPDGVRVRLGLWARGARGTVIVLPGRGEYIEKYGLTAAVLARAGYGVLTLDWRGQGLSDRLAEDRRLGHIDDFADYQADVALLREAATTMGLARPHWMIAHSMGGSIGLRALCTGWPEISAAAFCAPMWGLQMNQAVRAAALTMGTMAQAFGRSRRPVPKRAEDYDYAHMPFDGNSLTTDRAMFDYMQRQLRAHPELELGAPSIGWLEAALREMRTLARLPAPALPAYVAIGSRERIVQPDAIPARLKNWTSARFETFEGAEHELLMEAPKHRKRFIETALGLFSRGAWAD